MIWAVFTSPFRDFLFPQRRLPVLPVETSCLGGSSFVPSDEEAGQDAVDGKRVEAA